MTLRTARRTINEIRILVTVDDEYIILDYLKQDMEEFRKSLVKIESYYNRKVDYINYNTATECIQIHCK